MTLSVLRRLRVPVTIELVPEMRMCADAFLELPRERLRRRLDCVLRPARRVDEDRLAELAQEASIALPNHERGKQRRSRQMRDHRRRPQERRRPAEERDFDLIAADVA